MLRLEVADPPAVGAEPVGTLLERRLAPGAVTWHDRRLPGSLGNVDHVVIASSGVWIVDAKQCRGRIERRGRRDGARLYVDRRDWTGLVAEMRPQLTAITDAIDDRDVPVQRVLCLAGGEWPFFAKPFALDGVWVTWPRALVDTIDRAGECAMTVPEISARMSAWLATR